MPSTKSTKTSELKSHSIKKMEDECVSLKEKVFTQNLEEHLSLLKIVANLLIMTYQEKIPNSEEKMIDYWSKLREYYQYIETDISLSSFAKAEWAAFVASAYQQTEYYEQAIVFYKKALVNEVDSKPKETFIQSIRLELIGLYLKSGYQYAQKDARITATLRYEKGLEFIEKALNAEGYHPKLYYLKAQTLAYLAGLSDKNDEITSFLHQAIGADYNGLKITNELSNQKRYIAHIQHCCEQWFALTQNSRTVPSGFNSLFKDCQTFIQDANEKNYSVVLERLQNIFENPLGIKNKMTFWQVKHETTDNISSQYQKNS